MVNDDFEKFLADENEHLNKLRKIVSDTIREEHSILNNLLHPPKEMLNRGQKISDKVARFGGSWTFIIIFGIILLLWIVANTVILRQKSFDPYPFILMNLILSCIAALQAPVIMMSQNRQEEKDRMREENDYMINLKAEIEIRSLHQKIDLLLEDQIRTLFETQSKQFGILQEIRDELKKR
jgi:uncharacterized membrane protein